MRTSEIEFGDTVYAVAVFNEGDAIGHERLRKCTVEAVGVERKYWPADRGIRYRAATATDGVRVVAVDEDREWVVRPHAVKATWDEHAEVLEENRVYWERVDAAMRKRRERVEDLGQRARALGLKVNPWVRSHQVTLPIDEFEALVELAETAK